MLWIPLPNGLAAIGAVDLATQWLADIGAVDHATQWLADMGAVDPATQWAGRYRCCGSRYPMGWRIRVVNPNTVER